MTYRRNILAGAAIILACGLPAGLFAADPVPAHITAAINALARDHREIVRDPVMKPADVLMFSEVKPGGVVAELVPGDTYWTKLFSKSVGNQGHVYPVDPIRGYRTLGPRRAAEAAAAKAKGQLPVDSFDAALALMFVTDFKNVKAIAEAIDAYDGEFAIPDQADVVFNGQGYHEFHNKVQGEPLFSEPYDMELVNQAIYRAMKPGAVYIISDYAAAPGAGFSKTDSLKRVDPEALKLELGNAGFEFAGSLDVYANPGDDHTKPADPANKPDRFVLKFRKPRNAPATDKRPRGEVLAKWLRAFDGNTFYFGGTGNKAYDAEWFPAGMYYHADGLLQERVSPETTLVGTYFWDADGRNCQYHEPPEVQGLVVCHPMEEVALNAKPGDTWVQHAGFKDTKVSQVGLLKGIVLPKPRPAPPQVAPAEPVADKPAAAPAAPGRAGAGRAGQ